MPRPTKGPRLGSSPSHQKMMLNGLAASLIMDERIQTTETRAKRVRPVVEKLVTLGKSGSVHSRRKALSLIEDRDVVHKLFDDIAPRFSDRSGGYVRILKLGPRKGDAAAMALIEFVEEGISTATESEEPKKKGRRRRRRKAEDAAPSGSTEASLEEAAAETVAPEDAVEASEDSTSTPEELPEDEAKS